LQVGGMTLFPHEKVLKRLQELDEGEEGTNNVWDYFQVMRELCCPKQTKPRRPRKAKQIKKQPEALKKKKRRRKLGGSD
jgi:hypothetical protein